MFHKGYCVNKKGSKFKVKQQGKYFWLFLVICCTFKLYNCLTFHHKTITKSVTSPFWKGPNSQLRKRGISAFCMQ